MSLFHLHLSKYLGLCLLFDRGGQENYHAQPAQIWLRLPAPPYMGTVGRLRGGVWCLAQGGSEVCQGGGYRKMAFFNSFMVKNMDF